MQEDIAPNHRGRTTLNDIATAAGVSITTVSKVVNGKADVAASTRERVEQAMERLGYFKTLGSTKPTSKLIEIAFQHLDNSWTIDLLQGASEHTQPDGIRLVLSMLGESETAVGPWVEEVVVRRPLGVIVVFSKPSMSLAKRLASRQIPCAFIDPWGNPTTGTMSVQADNWSGGLFATRHLIELGHRRIATITGPENAMCSAARLDGYRAALREAGIEADPQLVRHGRFQVEDGERLATELLSSPRRPTAIFAQSDFIAMGVYRAAKELGLTIPEDLSVVGFDDIQTAAYMGPALTTIHQPLNEMASAATRMILDAHHGRPVSDRVILPTSLVVRESTCPPKE
ncbi:LacI family DNA-binding transcriptional regulator [Bifidobacterium avesanii]|uniref:LacI family DNA-binding transcriptional regulator n=1 Tax=Bifidobacterium avesanii TaxID=1798157 RepID=A0A7K3TK83_9BIFI|nr:LacI family DNA-binding transcriptional regulator [Bifidobacterium avesanii]KAB8291928.1 transcription regulator, LacI family [Bifidobacterium avesanii]NEG79030.1 LacI family DNA-binding transcriptional regulator [Bifidobacterium avesanii]